MNIEDFQKLLKQTTENTQNVRSYNKNWYSGVSKVPDEKAREIGGIVLFLQEMIYKGELCKPGEYLMIYNFQPLHISDTDYLCSLDMVIRPMSKINDLESCDGETVQLVVDINNRKILNNAYGMLLMGIGDEDEGPCLCYGNYSDYLKHKSNTTHSNHSTHSNEKKLSTELFRLNSNASVQNEETKGEKDSQAIKIDSFVSKKCIPKPLTFSFNYSRVLGSASPTSAPDFSLLNMEKDMENESGSKLYSIPCQV